jgi:sec-independent protein translocase protein TatC
MDKEKTVKEHLKELRNGIIWIFLPSIILFFVFFSFGNTFINFILNYFNLEASALTPASYINSQMQVAMVLALIVMSPMVYYKLYTFVKPAMPNKMGKKINRYVLGSELLAIAGAIFGFTVFAKYTLNFLSDVPSTINVMWSIDSILSFVLMSVSVFAISFQSIIVMPLINKAGIISLNSMKKYRKHVLVLLLIISGIITPSVDAWTMGIMAVPLYACYETGLQVCKLNKNKEETWHGD